MIRAIFFDLDDTLIRYTGAERVALDAGCDVAMARNPNLRRAALAEGIYQSYGEQFGYGTPGFEKLGYLSVADLRRILTTDALRRLGDPADPDFVADINRAFEETERVSLRPFDDTIETLELLANWFPLGIITNGPSAMQRAKLAATDLGHRFQTIVVDTEFGHPKPDPRIFDYAARLIHLEPQELLFVGNSVEADVTGSVSAGWTSVWFNAEDASIPAHLTKPHFTIRQLSDLLHILPVAEAIRGFGS